MRKISITKATLSKMTIFHFIDFLNIQSGERKGATGLAQVSVFPGNVDVRTCNFADSW